jgi:uncharacterized protein
VSALFATVVTASLLGSLHCAGMCGGLVALYAADARGRETRAHFAYHAGRLSMYATLGAVAGALGGLMDHAGTLAGVAHLAAIVAGAAVALWGIFKLAGIADDRIGLPKALSQRVARFVAGVRRHPPTLRAGLLGLSSALLPCGWLYAFVAVAAGSGTALAGAGVMATFWLGTVPALAFVGISVRRFAGPLGRKLPIVSAVALIVVGLGTVWMRASHTDAIGGWLSPPAAESEKPSCH